MLWWSIGIVIIDSCIVKCEERIIQPARWRWVIKYTDIEDMIAIRQWFIIYWSDVAGMHMRCTTIDEVEYLVVFGRLSVNSETGVEGSYKVVDGDSRSCQALIAWIFHAVRIATMWLEPTREWNLDMAVVAGDNCSKRGWGYVRKMEKGICNWHVLKNPIS